MFIKKTRKTKLTVELQVQKECARVWKLHQEDQKRFVRHLPRTLSNCLCPPSQKIDAKLAHLCASNALEHLQQTLYPALYPKKRLV
jgi:hypothetical protein